MSQIEWKIDWHRAQTKHCYLGVDHLNRKPEWRWWAQSLTERLHGECETWEEARKLAEKAARKLTKGTA